MSAYLEYADSLAYVNSEKGHLLFYCISNIIEGVIPSHHHDFLEISFVAKGHGTETLNGVTHELKPGSISFLLPHHIHEIQSSPETPLHLYCLMFDISIIFDSVTDTELGRVLLQTGHELPSYNDLDHPAIMEMNRICTALFAEYQNSAIAKSSSIRCKLIEALVLYVRSHSNTILNPFRNQITGMKKLDWEIIQHVHTNYLSSLTQDSLCKKFNVSPAYISRLFKKFLNKNFLDYLHTLRVRRASTLLRTTEMSIFDISVDSGFESFRTFSRVFKEQTGMTPRDFKVKSAIMSQADKAQL